MYIMLAEYFPFIGNRPHHLSHKHDSDYSSSCSSPCLLFTLQPAPVSALYLMVHVSIDSPNSLCFFIACVTLTAEVALILSLTCVDSFGMWLHCLGQVTWMAPAAAWWPCSD